MHHQSRRLPNRHEPAGHAVHNPACSRPSIGLTVIATAVSVAVASHALATGRRLVVGYALANREAHIATVAAEDVRRPLR